MLNPLTPVPPVTARDEHWPFFLFWRHHFWPKLASSLLNSCRRKWFSQCCPDQSDQPYGALDMHKNAQKVEWKAQSKISCHYTWPQKIDFCAYPCHSDAGGKKDKLLCCKRIFDRIKATCNLAEIQLKKHQNVQKTHFLQKVPESMG